MTPTTAMILSSSCVEQLALEVFTGWKTQGRTSDDVEVHPFARMAAGYRNEADRTSQGCAVSPQIQPDPAPHLVPVALELAASSSRESSVDGTVHGTKICLARIVGALPTGDPSHSVDVRARSVKLNRSVPHIAPPPPSKVGVHGVGRMTSWRFH
jgi:hypothetical protein